MRVQCCHWTLTLFLQVASPAEFVHRFGGRRVIERVLVANNGIAAVKCIRSIRRWAYEVFNNDRAIKFFVMVTPEDMQANAEYIKLADSIIPVPGGSNNHNYANCDLILDVAKRSNVQVRPTPPPSLLFSRQHPLHAFTTILSDQAHSTQYIMCRHIQKPNPNPYLAPREVRSTVCCTPSAVPDNALTRLVYLKLILSTCIRYLCICT